MTIQLRKLAENDVTAAALANSLAKTSRTPAEKKAAFAVKNARLSAALVTLPAGQVDLSWHELPSGGQALVIGLPNGEGGRATLHTFVHLLAPRARETVFARIGAPPNVTAPLCVA